MPVHLSTRIPLARHQRTGPTFGDVMAVSAVTVLDSMDRAGDDVPNQRPTYAIGLTGVGLRRRGVLVRIHDPFESPDDVHAICRVDVTAGVPATHRGIHASRIGHAIAQTSAATYRDVAAYAETLARAVADAEYGHAGVRVHAAIPYLEEVCGDGIRGAKLSLEHLHVIAAHRIDGARASSDVGLRVAHLTACPCVQNTYRHAGLVERGGHNEDRAGAGQRDTLMTHSQRCLTTVMAHDVTAPASVMDILTRLDGVLVRTCNTLPRDAELAIVYRAHRTPQFIEDALRAAVVAMARAWPASPPAFSRLTGRGRSLESIHAYDLTASLSLSAADVLALR